MITIKDNAFRLDTENTSYLFQITRFGHLEHLYYGARLAGYEAASGLAQKQTVPLGCTILYDSSDELYCLDNLYLEWSDIGRGDYRQSPTELKMPDGNFTSDFVYHSHNVLSGSVSIKSLPSAYNADQTLVVTLKDKCHNIFLDLYFTVFERTDVITRRAALTNKGDGLLSVRRIMSLSLDLPDGSVCETKETDPAIADCIQEFECSNRALAKGIPLPTQFSGSGYNENVRLYGDFGSDMYIARLKNTET